MIKVVCLISLLVLTQGDEGGPSPKAVKLQNLQTMVRSLVQQVLSVPGMARIGSMGGCSGSDPSSWWLSKRGRSVERGNTKRKHRGNNTTRKHGGNTTRKRGGNIRTEDGTSGHGGE